MTIAAGTPALYAFRQIDILLVDDNQDFINALEDIVKYEDFTRSIRSAECAEEAFELLRNCHFDMVLVDLVMPGTNGIELTRQIKKLYPHIRVVVLTLYDTAEYRLSAKNAGADAFVSKRNVNMELFPVVSNIFDPNPLYGSLPALASSHSKASAFEALLEVKERLCVALRAGDMAFWDWDLQTGIILWSEEHARIFGLELNEFDRTFEGFIKHVHTEDRPEVVAAIARARNKNTRFDQAFKVDSPSAGTRWISLKGEFSYGDDARPVRMTGIVSDITEAMNRERQIADQAARLRAIFDESVDCIIILGKSGNIHRINPTGLDLLEAGFHTDVADQSILGWILPKYQEAFQLLLNNVWRGNQDRLEFELAGLKGTRRWVEMNASRIYCAEGKHGILGVIRDITERKAIEEKLSYMAQYDALTGLPNRVLFKDRLHQAIIEADRHKQLVGVVFLDIDRFKNINDTLGHQAGDQVLTEVAGRLSAVLRSSDTVAHLSGDEFAVVLADMSHVEDASRVLKKIADVFDKPIVFQERELFVTASMGITVYPVDNSDAETLLRNADIAMYRAKDDWNNSYQFYAAEMTAMAREKLTLEQALRYAIEREQLVLHYQPQVDLKSGKITGIEALLRWNHPEHGLVPPLKFIPLAEETGLIVPIGEWVLRTAIHQTRHWQSLGFASLRVAVNLSTSQLQQANALNVVRRILAESSLDASTLELELTESMLLDNVEQTMETLHELKTLGVTFSIDDFGTGYSSLSYLRKFPVGVLKIDRSFVCDINKDPGADSIVKTIIQMAHTLGMRVVAEGVENREQLMFLRSNRCDSLQGYYFSKPLPADAFTKLLESGKSLSPTDRFLNESTMEA